MFGKNDQEHDQDVKENIYCFAKRNLEGPASCILLAKL